MSTFLCYWYKNIYLFVWRKVKYFIPLHCQTITEFNYEEVQSKGSFSVSEG